jgi:hypothetical protein
MRSPTDETLTTGSISTLLALALDVYVFKQAVKRGKYQNMQDADLKHAEASFADHDMAGLSGAQEMDTHTPPPRDGYSVPQQQFVYDTSYGASRTGFRD